jgi:ABC-type transporter Mla MlaB component
MFSLFTRKDKASEKELEKDSRSAKPEGARAGAPVPAQPAAVRNDKSHSDPRLAKLAASLAADASPLNKAGLAPSSHSSPAPQRQRAVDQNEAARRTTASIDAIEFEMMASKVGNTPKIEKSGDFAKTPPGLGRASPSPSSAAVRKVEAALQMEARESPNTLPKLDHSTSIVLGDTSGALNIDVSGTTLPPMIEEAAILFANGQAKESVDSLKHAIGSGELENQVQTAWVMLLDVYQSTGQRAEFENTALDYAARFEASPPAWLEETSVEQKPEAKKGAMAATVIFPAALDAEVSKHIEQLQRGSATKRELQLDFGNAKTADSEGAELIYKVLMAFKKTQREITIVHADRLFEALMSSVEAGRKDASEAGWLLALEALRLMNQQQRFDDVSIDYCVTYEVSPPPWEPMPAWIKQSQGSTEAKLEAAPKSGAEGNSFAIRGNLIGPIASELAELRAYSQSASSVVIDCRELRRVDFTAAGELLNVVATLRANGKQVLFVEPNWMVLALMVVMGLHDLAEIRRRKI